jgi:hypothetical protein
LRRNIILTLIKTGFISQNKFSSAQGWSSNPRSQVSKSPKLAQMRLVASIRLNKKEKPSG